jgi:rubrerythrin
MLMEIGQVKELLIQSLEVERGGVKIYEAAVGVAQNEDLKEEWQKYLDQTRTHVTTLERVITALGMDPKEETPGSKILAELGNSFVQAIETAKEGDPAAAEIVAAEVITLAETKDHLDWELIGEAAQKLKGDEKKQLLEAYEEIEDQEDEHLYHTRGWCRELWLKSLGIKPMLPPPEERKHVKTAIGAARAEQSRKTH